MERLVLRRAMHPAVQDQNWFFFVNSRQILLALILILMWITMIQTKALRFETVIAPEYESLIPTATLIVSEEAR